MTGGLRTAWFAWRDCFPGPARELGYLYLIVLAGKLAGLGWAGVSYEMDSATYLAALVPYHHPPVYALFLGLVRRFTTGVAPIALAQTLIFCGGAALFLLHFVPRPRWRHLAAALLALEPVTSHFCRNLMSEALFVAVLLVWVSLLDALLAESRTGRRTALVIGNALALALLYAIRLPAVILIPFTLALLFLRRPRGLTAVLHSVLLLAVFQLGILPVKLLYLKTWNSFSVTLFSGSSLWNSASVLYPDSAVRHDPRTDFEKFLATRPADEFTTRQALWTEAIHGEHSAYADFDRMTPMDTDQRRDFEHALARTSMRIIAGNPLGYLTRFVLPNYLQPLTLDDEVVIDERMAQYMQSLFGYRQRANVTYRARTWQLYLGLLVVSFGLQLGLRGPRPVWLLLAVAGYYALALPVLAAVFIRFMLVLAPLIGMAAFLVILRLGGIPGDSANA